MKCLEPDRTYWEAMTSGEITQDMVERVIEAVLEEGLLVKDEDGGLWLPGEAAGLMGTAAWIRVSTRAGAWSSPPPDAREA